MHLIDTLDAVILEVGDKITPSTPRELANYPYLTAQTLPLGSRPGDLPALCTRISLILLDLNLNNIPVVPRHVGASGIDSHKAQRLGVTAEANSNSPILDWFRACAPKNDQIID